MALVIRALDVLIALWMMFIGAILISGGGVYKLPHGQLEVSELAAWVLILILLHAFRQSVAMKAHPSPLRIFLDWFVKFLHHFDPRAFRVSLIFLTLLFTWIHIERHWSFHTGIWDLGIIHHTLYRLWTSAPFSCDLCINGTYLADHLAFILAIAAPVAGIFQSSEALFLVESCLMAAGVALIVQRGPLLGLPKLWLIALALIVCHPAIRNAWIWDFREDHFAFALLSAAAVAAYRGEGLLLAFSSAMVLLSKENMAFILPGLYLAAGLENRKLRPWLWSLSGLCLVYAWISFHHLIPAVGGAVSSNEVVLRFPGMGTTPSQVVAHLLTHPMDLLKQFASHCFSRSGVRYWIGLAGPWLYLGLSNPLWLVPALPGFLMNLISANDAQRSLQFHYDLVILPFLAFAMLQGISKASPRKIAFAILLAVLFSGRWPGLAIREFWPNRQQLSESFWLREITKAKRGILAADDQLIAQVAMRDELRLYSPTEKDWDAFFKDAIRDRTGLPGHSLQNAQWVIFNTARSSEAHLLATLSADWKIEDRSPDGRLVLVGKTP